MPYKDPSKQRPDLSIRLDGLNKYPEIEDLMMDSLRTIFLEAMHLKLLPIPTDVKVTVQLSFGAK